MNWVQISVSTTHDGTELIGNLLLELGATGVEIDDPKLVNDYIDAGLWDYTDLPRAENTATVTVSAYIAEDDKLNYKLGSLQNGIIELRKKSIFNLGDCVITQKILADEDWAESWKAYFHPEKIGKRIVICPTWEEYLPCADEIVISLDPGAAFGTGNHATTSMCIRYLEDLIKSNMRVFDVGTGSGILSIVAKKLGASEVLAVDYDSVAVRIAKENIAQNELDIEAMESDLFSSLSGRGTADVIIANIIADIIIRLLADLDKYLAEGGTFLASGIIADRENDVLQAVIANGFVVTASQREKEWVAMVIRRHNEV